ncbi:unnamed protein product [Echinostoma caproni]|uniref:Energy-coupling factor transporter transmembrane protein EcfT n=1 Tax=Echinostoma caproni TaxID=27848 RepID=A0A183A3G3_9TREM|nr:unnamed protein product [Echinostoma caproni]
MSVTDMHSKLQALQNAYREHWTRFNLTRMWLGACLMLSSVLFWSVSWSGLASLLWIGQLSCTVLVLFDSPGFNWMQIPFTILCSVIILLMIVCWLRFQAGRMVQTWSITFVLILALVHWSNSFLVNEFRVTHFLIQTLILCNLVPLIKRTDVGGSWSVKRVFGLSIPIQSLFLLLIIRFSLGLEMCREESYAQSVCRSGTDPWLVKPLGKLSPAEAYSLALWRVLFSASILTGFTFGLRRWLQRTGLLNRWNGTRFAVEALVPLGLLVLIVCWILDVAPVALQHSKILSLPTIFL